MSPTSTKVIAAVIAVVIIIAAIVGIYYISMPPPAPTPTPTPTPTPPPGPSTIAGKVTDVKTGAAVSGATVTANGYRATTGPDGVYSLSVRVGKYTLTATIEGYKTETASVDASEEKTYTVNVSLMPVPRGTLRVGWTTEVNSLNPTTCWSTEGGLVIDAMFGTLYTISREFEAIPDLVKSEEISADFLTWDLELVPDATWSDGAKLDADSVVYSFEVLLKTMPPMMTGYLEFIDSIEKTGDYSIRINMKYAMPASLVKILLAEDFVFLREKELGPLDQVELDDVTNYAPEETKVTNGAFKMIEWKKGEYISLGANEDYRKGSPHIEKLVFVRYLNEEAMVEALIAGELDMTYERIPVTMVKLIQSKIGLGVAVQKSHWMNEIAFNMGDWNEYMRPALLQPEVRKAFAYCMDYQKIIDLVWLGYAEANPSIVSSAGLYTKYHNKELEYFPFDIEKAKEILEENGWVDTNGNGWRDKELTYTIMPLALDEEGNLQIDDEGRLVRVPEDQWITKTERFELDFDVWIETSYAVELKCFEVMKPSLNEAGINIRVQLLEGSVLYDRIWGTEPPYALNDFDIIGWGWDIEEDPTYIMEWMSAYQIGSWSDACYHDPEFNLLYLAQKREIDEAKRIEIIKEMQAMVYRDLPYIVMCWPDQVQGYNIEKFEGYVNMPLKGIANEYTFEEVRLVG